MNRIPFEYHNLPIPGGGYVTGFQFHPVTGQLYIRTDIGGCYRYDREADRWDCISEYVSGDDLSETFPIAVTMDEKNPECFFAITGERTDYPPDQKKEPAGVFAISTDGGNSFSQKKIPFFVHGNANGRGTGKRLVMKPGTSDTLFFASQKDGLLKTDNLGDTWSPLWEDGPGMGSFVFAHPSGKSLIYAAADVDGMNTREMSSLDFSSRTGLKRVHSLYFSADAGTSFEKLNLPKMGFDPKAKVAGLVGHRYAFDGTYFYCTLNETGPFSYIPLWGYSCDGGSVTNGRVLRFKLDPNGAVLECTEITPRLLPDGGDAFAGKDYLNYGFGGIAICEEKKGLVAVSTLCRDTNGGEIIYLSEDYGQTWRIVLFDLSIGKMDFATSYMKPEFNGGHNLIHWLSDLAFHPQNPQELWFNSGTGVFCSDNVLDDVAVFRDVCTGIEETVHLNVYSLPKGPVKVLDIVGDLGGFAFQDTAKDCRNSFADENGNRYITCINADFPDADPSRIIVAARGNWTGKTKGGMILSQDYGQTFDRIPFPYGLTDYLDEHFHEIEKPNVNPGWVSMNADGSCIVFGITEGICLYMKGVITGRMPKIGNHIEVDKISFSKTKFYRSDGQDVSESDLVIKIFSDSVNPDRFYGFGNDLMLFESTDGGQNFYEIPVPMKMEGLICNLIDTANRTEIRRDAGVEGQFYAALGKFGMWKILFKDGTVKLTRIGREDWKVCRIGLGVKDPGVQKGGAENIGDQVTCDQALCDQVSCDQALCDQVACDQAPCDQALCDQVSCDQVSCDQVACESNAVASDGYYGVPKAIYFSGWCDGEYGLYRTMDEGETIEHLEPEGIYFGEINSIDGDCREYGVYYLATGSFGLKMGREISE